MSVHFQKEISIRFRDADPAGIAFFAHVFDHAHDCFEDFIQAAGLTWSGWFRSKEFIVPIRHTECLFHRPFRPGESYQVTASVSKLGDSSFQMKYIFSQGSFPHAEVRMTHVFLDFAKKEKIAIPDQVRRHLKVYLDGES